MPFLIKQKFNIYDLAPEVIGQNKVIVLEPDFYLANLYKKYLEQSDFLVSRCSHPDYAQDHLAIFSPKALLVNSDSYKNVKMAAKAIEQYLLLVPGLVVVTLGFNTNSEDLRHLLDVGVCGHINRWSSRPKEIVELFNSLVA